MDVEELRELFRKNVDGDEFLEFDRVELKRSSRPDLHAFITLDRMVGGSGDIIAAAEHDVIYLDISISELAKVVYETDIIDLIRCGVLLDEGNDYLMMYA